MRGLGGAALALGGFVALWVFASPALPVTRREEAWLVLAMGRLLAVPVLLGFLATGPSRAVAVLGSAALLAAEIVGGPLIAGLGLEPEFLKSRLFGGGIWFAPLLGIWLASRVWAGRAVALLASLGIASAIFFAPFGLDHWLAGHQGDWNARSVIAWSCDASPATRAAEDLGFDLFKQEELYARFLVGEQLGIPFNHGRTTGWAVATTVVSLMVFGAGGWLKRPRKARYNKA